MATKPVKYREHHIFRPVLQIILFILGNDWILSLSLLPLPPGSSIVPANGILLPERSDWQPSTGTLRPDPTGSGYSIPSKAGTHMSECGRGISPVLMDGVKHGRRWRHLSFLTFPRTPVYSLCCTSGRFSRLTLLGNKLGKSWQLSLNLVGFTWCIFVIFSQKSFFSLFGNLAVYRVKKRRFSQGFLKLLEGFG